MGNALDKVRVATITFLASIVLIIVAYVSNDIEFQTAFECLALAGGGSAAVGYVRNQAGHGTGQER